MAKKQDGLVKYQCDECENEFIVGLKAAEKLNDKMICPFCETLLLKYNQQVFLPADDERNEELGCMGIYYEE
jgi:hypothetical protein